MRSIGTIRGKYDNLKCAVENKIHCKNGEIWRIVLINASKIYGNAKVDLKILTHDRASF
jgi:hypothetical protein